MASVSVIMAVYNVEKYLAAAIESVLEQTYAPIEFIIINDGSEDSTEEIIRKYEPKVRYFHQSNQGQPSAQNQGLRLATGDYIAFLDGDDLYSKEKTTLQIQRLQEAPEMDMIFGHVEQFISPELPLKIREKWQCPTGSATGYLAATGLFRRKAFERVGLFSETQKLGPFIEWYMRATDAGLKHEVIPKTVLQRRIHENNMGIREKHSRLEYVQIVKAALKRRSLGV